MVTDKRTRFVSGALSFVMAVATLGSIPLPASASMSVKAAGATELTLFGYAMEGLDEQFRLEGDQCLEHGWYQEAIAAYDESLKLNPDNVTALYGRAIARVLSGDARGAVRDLTLAIKKKPDFSDAYYARGYCMEQMGDRAAALRDFTTAADLFKQQNRLLSYEEAIFKMFEQYRDMGREKAYRGNHRGALEDFDQALALNPDSAGTYCDRALVEYALGDSQSALSDLNCAVAMAPLMAVAVLERGSLLYCLGDYTGALHDLNHALRMSPDNADAYYMRGLCLAELGQTDAALTDFKLARKFYEGQNNERGIERADSQISMLA